MDRRKFLGALGVAAGGMAVGGIVCVRNLYERNQLEKKLLTNAEAVLADKALHELRELPIKGREEIRVWFHEPCLNADLFAASVSSEAFLNRLSRCGTDEQRNHLFLLEFLSKVTSAEEIMNRTAMIAEEIGDELDLNWEESCRGLASKWHLQISEYGDNLSGDLSEKLEPAIRQQIDESLRFSATTADRPSLIETAGNIGESALLLLPMVPFSRKTIPLFIFTAVKHFFDYFCGLLQHPRDRIRRGVSSRLALLANRIATEFESDVTTAISHLHDWQQNSVNHAAVHYAEKAVPWYHVPTLLRSDV